MTRDQAIDHAVRLNMWRLQGSWNGNSPSGNKAYPFVLIAPSERFCRQVRADFVCLMAS